MEPKWLTEGLAWSVTLGYAVSSPEPIDVPQVKDLGYWEYVEACQLQMEERY